MEHSNTSNRINYTPVNFDEQERKVVKLLLAIMLLQQNSSCLLYRPYNSNPSSLKLDCRLDMLYQPHHLVPHWCTQSNNFIKNRRTTFQLIQNTTRSALLIGSNKFCMWKIWSDRTHCNGSVDLFRVLTNEHGAQFQ